MEREVTYSAAYTGSKNFTQHNVKTANANGFGAAADDYMERGIDLNEQLILNKPATFFLRMNGDAMIEDGIFSGDVLIVDRSIKPASGKVIVAILDGELLVRRLQKNFNSVELIAANRMASNRLIDVESLSEEELDILHKYYCIMVDETKRRINLQESHSVEEAIGDALSKHEEKLRSRKARTTSS